MSAPERFASQKQNTIVKSLIRILDKLQEKFPDCRYLALVKSAGSKQWLLDRAYRCGSSAAVDAVLLPQLMQLIAEAEGASRRAVEQ